MAELIGSNHVVAVAQGGEVTLWDTAAEKLVWWLQAETYCEPVLSADRTRMIVKQGNRLVCLALPSGDCLGVIPCRDDNAIAMAISPDELHCAVAGAGLLRIYSLETGELESEFAIEGFRLPAGMREYGSKLSWMGDGHLLFAPYDSLYLIDVRLRSRIWEFELEKGFDFSVTASGELFYMAARERSGEIAAVVLPVMNPEWSKQLSEHSPEELVVVEQGTAVRLEVNAVVPKSRIEGRGAGRGDSPVDISQEVYERVAKKLQAAGWVIDPESSLCVYVYTGTPECLPYENIRRFNGGDGISDSGMRKGIVLHDDEFWYWGGLSPITRESGKAILANEDRHDPYFEMGFPFLVVPEVICREPTRGRAAFTFDGMRPGRFGVHERSIFWEKGHPLAEQQ